MVAMTKTSLQNGKVLVEVVVVVVAKAAMEKAKNSPTGKVLDTIAAVMKMPVQRVGKREEAVASTGNLEKTTR